MSVHLRRHWKKYLLAGIPGAFIGQWGIRKYRDNNVIRQLSVEAKNYGDDLIGFLDKPKRALVFLNPQANNGSARKKFSRFAAPLLHLSGIDVTVVESDYEGQIRTLLNYIDPKTDAIVVAGGDGTLMEVLNGMIRRSDFKQLQFPVGVIPLGKNNKFFFKKFPLYRTAKSEARVIGEATMNIVRGGVVPSDVMRIEPETGNVVYAVSGVEYGVFRDAEKNKDSFKLLGKLRTYFSYLNVAIRKWPVDLVVEVWIPGSSLTMEHVGSGPGRGSELDKDSPVGLQPTRHAIIRSTMDSNGADSRLPCGVVRCTSDQSASNQQQLQKSQHCEHDCFPTLTHGWRFLKFGAVAFKITFPPSRSKSSTLSLVVWGSTLKKNTFLYHGWKSCFDTNIPPESLPCEKVVNSRFVIRPRTDEESWMTIDGESYEAVPISISVLRGLIKIYGPK